MVQRSLHTVSVALLASLAILIAPVAASAGIANRGLPGAGANPIGAMTWGGYRLPVTDPRLDPPSAAFNLLRGASDRSAVDELLRQPRFRWFGSWMPLHTQHYNLGAYAAVRKYIHDVTGGKRSVGVGIGCRTLPSKAQIKEYRAWVHELARGIGRSRTALLLQPDMPFVLCLPHHSDVDMRLIAWTARTLSALPHTTVYIDAGAADWQRAGVDGIDARPFRGALGARLRPEPHALRLHRTAARLRAEDPQRPSPSRYSGQRLRGQHGAERPPLHDACTLGRVHAGRRLRKPASAGLRHSRAAADDGHPQVQRRRLSLVGAPVAGQRAPAATEGDPAARAHIALLLRTTGLAFAASVAAP